MKIDYQKYPVLKKIEDGNIGDITVFSVDKAFGQHYMPAIKASFNLLRKGINSKNTYLLSQTFVDAYESAGDNIFKSKLYSEVENSSALFLTPWGEQNLLDIRNDKEKKIIYTKTFTLIKNNTIGSLFDHVIDYNSLDNVKRSTSGWVSNNVKNSEENVFNLILMTLFIKYAEIDIKILAAKSKDNGIVCRYSNLTKSRVTILDSKWFTTLVKSDSFKVRGHFRLQPFGEGLKDKKLIWINDFEKSGYTATARKIKND